MALGKLHFGSTRSVAGNNSVSMARTLSRVETSEIVRTALRYLEHTLAEQSRG